MSNEKYQLVYFPNHPRSHVNGCVYEHIIVAEKILGRALSQEEVVHHEDENKRNNVDTNLIVFRTNADHIRFHKTGIREKNNLMESIPRQKLYITINVKCVVLILLVDLIT